MWNTSLTPSRFSILLCNFLKIRKGLIAVLDASPSIKIWRSSSAIIFKISSTWQSTTSLLCGDLRIWPSKIFPTFECWLIGNWNGDMTSMNEMTRNVTANNILKSMLFSFFNSYLEIKLQKWIWLLKWKINTEIRLF